jgi:hypothetical protein
MGSLVGYLRQAFLRVCVSAQAYRFPKLCITVDLDLPKVVVCAPEFGEHS